ncbi:MAG TPA: capsule assembly Wzi family protein [Ignavibacteria bacterium]|jgi:hypothetical protein
MKRILYFFFIAAFLYIPSVLGQVELVPLSNPVYDFLDRMFVNKIIDNYSASMLPMSRGEVGKYLDEINSKKAKISTTDKKLLDDYLVEFEYDVFGTLKKSSEFFSKKGVGELFSNKKQKYLLWSADSNASFFWDAIGEIRYIGTNGDSIGKPHVLLGKLGTRLRGTLFKSVGIYLRLSNGVRLGGEQIDANKTAFVDPVLVSTRKYVSEGSRTFDSFEGHLRYAPAGDWIAVTAGREALKFGTGFIDNLFLSNQNSAPIDFLKLDIKYKKIRYSFFHGSIVGNDSNGAQLSSKYLVFHRFEIGPLFNNVFKLGFNEMLIYSNIPINFAFLNPISFLTSADLNTELPGKNSNNALLGIDMQLYPIKSLTLQVSLLVDDLDFETLGDTTNKSNDNKFAFQGGLSWQNAFTLPNLNFVYEYTHIDPYVYSHREINNSYSHWGLPLGHGLNPNSDEHAFKLAYNFGSRLYIALTYKKQRSGMNETDSLGNVILNVGADILNGRESGNKNEFLKGLRVNRNIIQAELTWQPIRQYFFTIKYMMRAFDYTTQNRTLSDNIFQGIFRIDY